MYKNLNWWILLNLSFNGIRRKNSWIVWQRPSWETQYTSSSVVGTSLDWHSKIWFHGFFFFDCVRSKSKKGLKWAKLKVSNLVDITFDCRLDSLLIIWQPFTRLFKMLTQFTWRLQQLFQSHQKDVSAWNFIFV